VTSGIEKPDRNDGEQRQDDEEEALEQDTISSA
jgi:hypothetical protein